MSDDGYGFGRIYDNDYPDEARGLRSCHQRTTENDLPLFNRDN